MTDETWCASLVGAALLQIAKTDDGAALMLSTDRGVFRCQAEGDCCAHAYVEAIEGPTLPARGATIVRGWHKSHRSESSSEYGDMLDFDFYCLQTTAGYIDIELRTEHNGYYCGWLHEPVEVK